MDAVFALQRSGSDAVFAFQFPVAVGGADEGEWLYAHKVAQARRDTERARLERARIESERQARAGEIADAAVARAASVPAADRAADPIAPAAGAPVSLVSLTQVMQLWAAPVQPEPATRPVNLAALDEDAILAASILLMRRRG